MAKFVALNSTSPRPVVPGMVSVGVPSRNRRDLAVRAIRSILGQQYANVQVVFSDDASTDGTVAAIRAIEDRRIKLIEQAVNLGVVGNQNAVLDAADGEFFILFSDDDFLEPDAILRLVMPFLEGCAGKSRDEIGLTWCPCNIINADGAVMYVTHAGPQVESPADFLYGLYTGKYGPRNSSVMVRTADARAVGGYNPERGPICDTTNWGSAALLYDWAVCIPQPLVSYTVHTVSVTSQAQCADWARWSSLMLDDQIGIARRRGKSKEARRLESARKRLKANVTIDVLLRSRNRPGFLMHALRETLRGFPYMVTPYVIKRAFVDGWKLYRMK